MGDLYGLRNALYLGNYQQAVSEAMGLGASTERDFFMYRALIEQGQHRVVMDEVGAQAPVALQAVKMLASYLSGVSKEAVVAQLKEWLTDATAQDNWQLILVAATVFLHERDHKEALKISHQSTQIDVMALVVQIYLQMDRPDLARKLVKSMQEQYDDDTLTKLSHAWTSLCESGGETAQDALYEFQELGEKYHMSLMLLNAMASCNMHMGRFDEAERLLQEALSQSPNDTTSLINLVVCLNQLQKPAEVIGRYTSQLKISAPAHPWVAKYGELETSFDRCANQLSKE
ncbi:COPE1, epsilon subunit of the coatomer [Emiliania huxleyi CCMP1516]|uniref:Coatomer subunit epsilon n=2 Tax=Emiliania huxleyi TaxID=2903 RepID=A0A0D3IV24_EMIH1|nr:COPE1, epsilon subunit of the coatomer [Emiliania huxleyi CCMP1516]EOD15109.1 COPE1, epsilon subunit of the coatomer [Emiliania huxleyi CCMP1516]|eukprot:XP_005767538.1 COPE1, epsilon subunit of the coatomer [Emiliania huxleyi CCMP1516]